MNIITLIITILIYSLLRIGYSNVLYFREEKQKYPKEIEVVMEENNEVSEEKILEDVKEIEPEEIIETNEIVSPEEPVWELEIPKIDLNAEISEGTTEEVMNEYIGHFENTNTWNGNVGLAAHNRGYPVNYFARLKELEYGDEIIYRTKEGEKIYVVDLTTVINDTDWSYLEQTSDSKITLITCVENKPSLRRCVQGIEKT